MSYKETKGAPIDAFKNKDNTMGDEELNQWLRKPDFGEDIRFRYHPLTNTDAIAETFSSALERKKLNGRFDEEQMERLAEIGHNMLSQLVSVMNIEKIRQQDTEKSNSTTPESSDESLLPIIPRAKMILKALPLEVFDAVLESELSSQMIDINLDRRLLEVDPREILESNDWFTEERFANIVGQAVVQNAIWLGEYSTSKDTPVFHSVVHSVETLSAMVSREDLIKGVANTIDDLLQESPFKHKNFSDRFSMLQSKSGIFNFLGTIAEKAGLDTDSLYDALSENAKLTLQDESLEEIYSGLSINSFNSRDELNKRMTTSRLTPEQLDRAVVKDVMIERLSQTDLTQEERDIFVQLLDSTTVDSVIKAISSIKERGAVYPVLVYNLTERGYRPEAIKTIEAKTQEIIDKNKTHSSEDFRYARVGNNEEMSLLQQRDGDSNVREEVVSTPEGDVLIRYNFIENEWADEDRERYDNERH